MTICKNEQLHMKQEAFFGCLFNGYQEVKTIDFVGGYKASRIIGSVRIPC
jgi:hypothetical protein